MAIKLTKRKGFNFFRSYYDVYNELENNEDKVAFIDALFDRQFLGVKPTDLKGMSRFAYISQTNSIDSQVKGYEDKTKTRLDGSVYLKDGITPLKEDLNTPTDGGKNTPTVQVEEKEKEKDKEEEKEKLSLSEKKEFYENEKDFLKDWNEARIKILKVKQSNISKLHNHERVNFNLIKNDFTIEQFKNGIRGLMNQKDAYATNKLRPDHFLKDLNIEKYIDCQANGTKLFNSGKQKYITNENGNKIMAGII